MSRDNKVSSSTNRSDKLAANGVAEWKGLLASALKNVDNGFLGKYSNFHGNYQRAFCHLRT